MWSKMLHIKPLQKFWISTTAFLFFAIAGAWLRMYWLPAIPFAALLGVAAFTNVSILWFILIASIPLSTELMVTPSLGLDAPDEPLMMILTGISILWLAFKPQSFPKHLRSHHLWLLLLLHVAWIGITCIFSVNVGVSVKYLLAKFWFIIPFVVLPNMLGLKREQMLFAIKCLCVSMLFVAAQSLVRHALVNFTFIGINSTTAPFFRNHVNYSAMLVFVMAILSAAWWHQKKYAGIDNRILKWSVLICVAGIVLSFSRGAWVALLAGAAVIYFVRKNWLKQALLIAGIVLISFSTWLVYDNNYLKFSNNFNTTIFHENFEEHLQATWQLKDVSNAERFHRWVAGVRMSNQHLLSGYGPNNFYPHYKGYTVASFRTWVSDNDDHSSVHNYFLLMLIEQGIPGLIFFSILFIAMLLYAQKMYQQRKDAFGKTFSMTIAVLLTMIGCIIFMNDMIETDKVGSIFFLCLGLLIWLKNEPEELGAIG
jgi:O-antigen ligase